MTANNERQAGDSRHEDAVKALAAHLVRRYGAVQSEETEEQAADLVRVVLTARSPQAEDHEVGIEAALDDFLPRYVHRWEKIPNQADHRRYWRAEFERLVPFLSRVSPARDARHEDEGLPDCEHGYFAAGGTDTCPACDADALDYLEQRKAEAARPPQGEDHEADPLEAAYQHGYDIGRTDEKEAAIKAGVFRNGGYVPPARDVRHDDEAREPFGDPWGGPGPDGTEPTIRSPQGEDHEAPLPDWFYRESPLSMDALKGPDEQYMAGARDMLAVVRAHPEKNEGRH